MSVKRRWSFLALGSMIATAGFGSWGCCTVTCCETKPRNQLVLVMDADKPSIDPIVVSKSAGHEIAWRLPSDSTISHVAIALGGQPAPFERCATVETVCRIPCESGLCASGRIAAAVTPPEGGEIRYDYVFERPASAASADPTIIIRP